VRVAFHRAALDGGAPVDLQSGVVVAPAERETHLSCGPDAVVVSLRDGEDLSLVRVVPGGADFATPAPPISASSCARFPYVAHTVSASSCVWSAAGFMIS